MMYVIRPTGRDILHFNPNHDPRTGQFTSASGFASRIYNTAKKKEPAITKNMKFISEVTGAKLYGLENRLKTKDSIERKIKTDSKEKFIGIAEAANDIKDSVRYTLISDNNKFVKNYNETVGILTDFCGCEEVRCKNYFQLYKEGKVKHKSVQSVFKDKDGFVFEVQFQTPESQDAKNKKLPIYNERRKPGLSRQRQIELERQMEALAEAVSDPKDISKIKTH